MCCGVLPQVYGCLAVGPFVCILLGSSLPVDLAGREKEMDLNIYIPPGTGVQVWFKKIYSTRDGFPGMALKKSILPGTGVQVWF